MEHVYVKPKMSCTVRFFLKDEKGKYITWPRTPGRYQVFGCSSKVTNKGYVLEVTSNPNTCRDSLCTNVSHLMTKFPSPLNSIVTLEPPKNKDNKNVVSSSATIKISVSRGAGEYLNSKEVLETKNRLVLLATNAAEQKKVFMLLDVLLGPLAMLAEGPTAYTKTGAHRTKAVKVKDYSQTKAASTTLCYTGVSSFFVRHPGLTSLITGMARFAVEAWIDGMYDSIDKKVKLSATSKKLSILRRKKTLSSEDKKWLLSVVEKVKKDFLFGAKIKANPGAYPINGWTWKLFEKFITSNFKKKSLEEPWYARKNGVYNQRVRGFYDWCLTQKNPPSLFKRRPKHNWSGNGRVEFSV